jgi:hypothetical protein
MAKRRKAKAVADHVDALIAGYRTGQDHNGDLDLLLPHGRDPRVWALLTEIIRDPADDPMARTKALEYFERTKPPDGMNSRGLVKALLEIIAHGAEADSDDALVREWAVRALTQYAAARAVTKVVLSLVRDPRESRALRKAALWALADSAPWLDRKPLIETLVSDPVLGRDAQTLLTARKYQERPRPKPNLKRLYPNIKF